MTLLGTSSIDVFPLALGGNTFGWTSDEATSQTVLDAYLAGGGNFIDTADGYSAWVPGNSGGESETIIGNWTSSRRNRADIVIGRRSASTRRSVDSPRRTSVVPPTRRYSASGPTTSTSTTPTSTIPASPSRRPSRRSTRSVPPEDPRGRGVELLAGTAAGMD